MTPSDLSLSKLGPESDALLQNLLQLYIHDMSEWFETDSTPEGRYVYDTSVIWEHGYHAYLAKAGEAIAGFALIGSAAEWLGDAGSHDMHEFFILRKFRRSGLGQRMATLLWNAHSGVWFIRVLESNTPAVHFWRTSVSSASNGVYTEERRVSNGRPWRFFRFVSTATGQ
jgi:predicted acetyltransferase